MNNTNTNPCRAVFIAGPDVSAESAQAIATQCGHNEAILLLRRGTTLGWIAESKSTTEIDSATLRRRWQTSQPCVLNNFVGDSLPTYADEIEQALQLMENIANGEDFGEQLEKAHYSERLLPNFEMLAAFQDEGDPQEIETVEFDVVDNDDVIAENLWCKASWLSFEDDDASLRFRFSFGMPGYEDVAADLERQQYAGDLTDAIFPESEIITGNTDLAILLAAISGATELAYVERIVYFNTPNGGAQFHQDVERGHLGVVFAQLHGRTGWLTCAKNELIDEIQTFVAENKPALETLLPDSANRQQLIEQCSDKQQLNQWLDDNDNNEPLELLLNRCPEFIQQLIEHGHGYILNPGDIMLLPQKSIDECAWHTVFCLDDFAGEALSFAVREI